uniref:Peptidase S1 domain-containing protein n=1 Tax=Timema genevievae TaxID=629358 RepID=A0A7R9PRC2_TIMGE|nr:unnamed protein product [Timema genevievae]
MVAEPFSQNQYVKYVVLPVQDEKVPLGTHAIVAGWGKTLRDIEAPSPVLRHASVNVVEMKNCEERVPKPVVTIHMICGERKGQQLFKGDFGGPLIVRMGENVKQIGTASWGDFAEKDTFTCFYADISQYRLWIHQKTQI